MLVLACGFSGGVAADRALATPAPPAPPSRSGGIAWEKSFRDAAKKARALGRPMLVDFWAQWCQWCQKLDSTTYRDPEVVASASAGFVPVKVNTEGSLAEKQLSAQYGVEMLPTIAVLSPEGHVILLVKKFEGPDDFKASLQSAQKAGTQVMDWEATLSRNADDPAALAGLGAHLVGQGQIEDGRVLLERATKHDAGRPVAERKETRVWLGAVQSHAKHYVESERVLKAALDLQPADPTKDAELWLQLGQTYVEWGKVDAAREAWSRSLSVAPESPAAARARDALANLARH